jgi:hypothetical protein
VAARFSQSNDSDADRRRLFKLMAKLKKKKLAKVPAPRRLLSAQGSLPNRPTTR